MTIASMGFRPALFFWACHALVLKSDEMMTTAASHLTSSTGSSCFLTSGIAVQLPRVFLFHADLTPASALPILSSRELLAQFFEVPYLLIILILVFLFCL